MKLKYIKLSGFKSFVDSTKVTMPNNLVGIVGPNGCGKSNVIDAIRWVMGESSAKTLRGDSMEDVIFNGSSVRKPVNRAFVELVFDNSDGSAPGSYAKYGEIAIRRELVREAGSKYFINKARCRRKDIHDIFLGTGLGPRSYSIIEQGMVGRIVESKPEELRVLIEEAAGISKYKQRRRETENRIRRTRDNLSRVEDIISELETQLRRLKRQANAAERYKKFKDQQRELNLNQKTLRWSELHAKVQDKDVELERKQTEQEERVASQRSVESQLETMRQRQTELTESLNKVQEEYYSIGGEISALEQRIDHVQQTRKQQQQEYDRLVEAERDSNKHLEQDKQRLAETKSKLTDIEPTATKSTQDYDQALNDFKAAEQKYQSWLETWQQLTQEAANPDKERDVQSARIEQHDRQILHFSQRSTQLVDAINDIDSNLNIDEINELKDSVAKIDELCSKLENALKDIDQQMLSLREQLEAKREEYNNVRHQLQDDSARLNSLQALQAAALGETNTQLNQWLQQHGLENHSRLASMLQVDGGWEKAVDTVMSKYLNAIPVESLDKYSDEMSALNDGKLLLVDNTQALLPNFSSKFELLRDKVTAQGIAIEAIMAGIYIANDLTQALTQRESLAAHESIVTKEGIWIGANWALFGTEQDAQSGVLQREAEIEKLTESVESKTSELEVIKQQGESIQQQVAEVESLREQQSNEFRSQSQQGNDLHNQLGRTEARSAELIAQREKILIEQQELSDQLVVSQQELTISKKRMEDAESLASNFENKRAELDQEKAQLSEQLENSREQEQKARDYRQSQQIEFERLQNNQQSLTESIARIEKQLESQLVRRNELKNLVDISDDPTEQHQQQLKEMLEQRLSVEKKLSTARNELTDFEASMRSTDQQRLGFDRELNNIRDALEGVRINRQEIVVRRDTIAEELNQSVEEMVLQVQGLPDDIDKNEVDQSLIEIAKKLERIGAVNLVAIEEYEQCEERKVYLDKQRADLVEAMETLEAAINKIDRETRTRFKETFDSLNEGFQRFFPKLFGGGAAYLELTSNDMLDTGVSVMAQPPGKRNSTIHLLSGGEKALTAVALLFSFFDMNPAPFCVLDEVDAPLDDANVERYTEVLKQLSERTQLLFITHNKITMEAAGILIGVTMAEAGVSRLVAVDVDEATSMASQ